MEIDRTTNQPARGSAAAEHVGHRPGVQASNRPLAERSRGPATPTGAGDSVEISEQSRALARAREAVESASEIRADRVAALRAQIEAGTYAVPADEVAIAMLSGGDPT